MLSKSKFLAMFIILICIDFWSYLCISYQVINDLLDPTGQNLRVREDSQVCYLSFIGSPYLTVSIFFLRPFLKYPTYVLFEKKKVCTFVLFKA